MTRTVAEEIKRLGFDPQQEFSHWIAQESIESKFPDYSLDILQMGEQNFRDCFYKRVYDDVVSRSANDSNFDAKIFYKSLQKLMCGKCCISGCESQTELIVYAQSEAPKFCQHHIDDGEDTHSGQWINVSAYHDKWTCCDNNWKKSHCRKLADQLQQYACFIPTTQRQRNAVEEKDRIDTAKREEDEAFYRRMGYDEGFDR